MKKKSKSAFIVGVVWTGIILLLLAAGAFAAQTVVVLQPNTDGNYLKGTVGVSFSYVDGNFSEALHDVSIDIALSTTAGAFTTSLVADGNLDTYCGTGTDYAAGTTTCTFTFNTTTAPADGNYFVDINITTEVTGGGVDQNSVTDSSDNNFVIDNTVPTVTFTVPTAASTSASQTVTFDLNDNSSAIVLGSTIVLVNGVTSTVLVTGTDCTAYAGDHNYNCSYTETNISADGDYNITVSVQDLATNDANASADQNVSFTYDTSASNLTITTPTANQSFLNVTSVSFNYTTSDTDIAKYWVQIDSETEIDNSLNTSYTFTGLTVGTHTLKVKATDNLDNNSTQATVTITITRSGGGTFCGDNTCNGTETAATCPSDCSAICGDNACTGTESVDNCPIDCGPSQVCGNNVCDSGENFNVCPQDCEAPKGQIVRETVLSRESKGKPTPEDMRRILEAAGASPNAIEKATEALGKTNTSRTFEVIREENEDGEVTFTTIIEISVTNNSGNTLKNVKVIEEIPKQALGNANNVNASTRFNVLKEDPILEFQLGDLSNGQTKTIKYTINDQLTDQQIALFSMPFVSDFFEEAGLTCAELNCDDKNSCTIDSCENGRCLNIPSPDGQSCGIGLICQQGQCTDATTGEIVEVSEEDNSGLIIGIIVVILVALGAYFVYSRK